MELIQNLAWDFGWHLQMRRRNPVSDYRRGYENGAFGIARANLRLALRSQKTGASRQKIGKRIRDAIASASKLP